MSLNLDLITLNHRLLALYLQVSNSQIPGPAADILDEARSIRDQFQPANTHALNATFTRYLRLIALHLSPDAQAALDDLLTAAAPQPVASLPARFTGHETHLGPLTGAGLPGISVVTCSMNRTENLIKAIPSWLANPEISEILVVDWSSRRPVAQDLAQAGLTDPRIRILAVNNEPRWILSYAFNAGFRAAACDTILKVDADIVLSPDFFRHNHVGPGSFIAGNWRTASQDQSHVNGFFFVPRQGLHMVGGFNEHITTYGWDDDDIYERMILAGLRRRDVAPGTIFHLDHDDAARLGEVGLSQGVQTVGDTLTSGTRYLIRRNRYIASVMPAWDQNAIHLPFKVLAQSDRMMTLQRDGWEPSAVPHHIQNAGRTQSLTELLAWRFNRRVFQLDATRIDLLTNRANRALSQIDVEVAIANPAHVIKGDGHYLVLDLDGDVLNGTRNAHSLSTAFSALISAARTRGLTPVLRAPYTALPYGVPDCLTELPLIPSWEPLGQVPRLTVASLLAGPPAPGSDYGIDITMTALNTLNLSTPAIMVPRAKLYVDVQHGLGNRLRALGSAAAIASASNRELVVVWQPDDHCDGRLSDLYDYKGAVIEQRFLEQAATRGCDIYNYMTNEPGAQKDLPVRHDSSNDIYARAAFVLQNPHSSWESENRFLQSLIPIEQVRALVRSVRHPNALSAHIRMEAGAGRDTNSYDRPENWRPEDHALIHAWRAKSHFSHFLARIDSLIAEGRADTIFLAADLPETYAEFQDRYGHRLARLPRVLYDRSAAQLHYALADAILLSRAPLLLGSTWSSFSELAMRLAPQAIAIEMSGKDF